MYGKKGIPLHHFGNLIAEGTHLLDTEARGPKSQEFVLSDMLDQKRPSAWSLRAPTGPEHAF